MLWQFEDSTCPTISPVAICRANQRRPAFIRHTCPTKQKVIPAFPKKNFNLNPVLRIRILPDSSLSDLIQIFFLPEPHLNVFESFCADFHPASPCSNYFALSRVELSNSTERNIFFNKWSSKSWKKVLSHNNFL